MVIIDEVDLAWVDEIKGLFSPPEVDGEIRCQDGVFERADYPFKFILEITPQLVIVKN